MDFILHCWFLWVQYGNLFVVSQAVLWNMDTFQSQYTSEEHSLIITDVRFRPNSSQLATSSFDRTIKLWNAADVSYVFVYVYESGIGDYSSWSNGTHNQ